MISWEPLFKDKPMDAIDASAIPSDPPARFADVLESATALTVPREPRTPAALPVVDLFSGAGGMSLGFHAHPLFRLAGAADAEMGKPSTGFGALQCNATYQANIGLMPEAVDLAHANPGDLRQWFEPRLAGDDASVLISCAPCTGFSRARVKDHLVDDPRNGLVGRTADFAEAMRPRIIVMENVRELITGRFSDHYRSLRARLERSGYQVHGSVHVLSRFGLPQHRERAIVIAVARDIELRTLDELWAGLRIRDSATTVRRAIGHLPAVAAGVADRDDPMHVSSAFGDEVSLHRMQAIPLDGGSWIDLYRDPARRKYLTAHMWRAIERGRLNTFPDAYGRLAWDRPAPTIKRECSHVGNGRYTHPEQDRLCTVREMAILQGFPADVRFEARSRKNQYRQIGDAVPPLIAYQLAHLCAWMLTGEKPEAEQLIMPKSHLTVDDIEPSYAHLRLITG